MDPVQKLWMYEHWLADQNEQAELAKNHAYLLASFDHGEAVKQIMGGGNTHQSTDEEFEESSQLVKRMNAKLMETQKEQAPAKKRKRRSVRG